MRSIRASALPDLSDCARRGAARLFRFEVERAGFELNHGKFNRKALLGTATHSMFEKILLDKMDGKTTQSHDALAAGLAKIAEEFDKTEDDKDIKTTDDAEKMLSTMLATVEAVAQDIDPEVVELQMNMVTTIDDPAHNRQDQWEITGKVDVIAKGPKRHIIDLKTGGSLQPKNYMPQLGAYALLAGESDMPADRVGIIHIPRRKRDVPEPVKVNYNLIESIKMAEGVMNRTIVSYNEFEATGDPNAFNPNPQSSACSAQYCPAYGTDFCSAGAGE